MDISLLNYCTNDAPHREQALVHDQKIIQGPVLKGDSDFTSALVQRGLETPKMCCHLCIINSSAGGWSIEVEDLISTIKTIIIALDLACSGLKGSG